MISAADVRDFQLTRVPPEFLDDPYAWYAALREHDPLHALEGRRIELAGTPERDRRVRFRGFRRLPVRAAC